MSRYSPQKWFCNACGAEQFSAPSFAKGRKFNCCSMECVDEMDWRDTLSILNKPYYPDPRPRSEKECVLGEGEWASKRGER